jgi:hypothetical protein
MNTTEEQQTAGQNGEAQRLAQSEGAAVIFVRRKATMGIGHVGWGFLLQSGKNRHFNLSLVGDGNVWEIGAVENHHGTIITPPLEDGYWCEKTAEPLNEVAGREYDHYKVIPVEEPNIAAALKEELVIKERPYVAAVGNCMNDVYNILTAYGVKGLPDPSYILNWLPNAWYDHISAPEYEIEDQGGLNESPAANQPN